MARKWIIENGEFKEGCVELHCELSSNKYKSTKNDVEGGGISVIDTENKVIYLYGKSYDFGKCSVEEVRSCSFNFTLDNYTIKFTTEENLNKVLNMPDSEFDFIRYPLEYETE